MGKQSTTVVLHIKDKKECYRFSQDISTNATKINGANKVPLVQYI
jgi:hypothetical protein